MKSEIENVVQWLRGNDEVHWQDHVELIEEVLWDVRNLTGPLLKPRDGEHDQTRSAIPYLHEMLFAMSYRNRRAAIESGTAALKALNYSYAWK